MRYLCVTSAGVLQGCGLLLVDGAVCGKAFR
jgi:hypothetical protein